MRYNCAVHLSCRYTRRLKRSKVFRGMLTRTAELLHSVPDDELHSFSHELEPKMVVHNRPPISAPPHPTSPSSSPTAYTCPPPHLGRDDVINTHIEERNETNGSTSGNSMLHKIVNLLPLLESAELCHYYIIHFNLCILTLISLLKCRFVFASFIN